MPVETSNIRSAPLVVDDATIHKPLTIEHIIALRQAYEQQRYEVAVDQLVGFLKWLKQQRTEPFDAQETQLLTVMLKMITIMLRDPNTSIPPQHLEEVISSSEVFAKAFALCQFPPPDDALQELLKHPTKLPETLLCLSTHTRIDVNIETLITLSPILMSLWWSCMIRDAKPALDPQRRKRLLAWVKHPAMLANYHFISDAKPNSMLGGYFDITYIDDSNHHTIKTTLNKQIKHYLDLAVPNNPTAESVANDHDFKSVLVISDLFRHQHAVYRSLAPLLRSLKGHYRLGFINHAQRDETIEERGIDATLFDDIYRCDSLASLIQQVTEEIKPGIILLPDISMTVLSLLTSNLRLAPIQCTGYGHPVSSFATEMDYFIGSADGEDISQVQQRYSEKAVLIPGIAAIPVLPKYNVPQTNLPTNPIRISLAWGTPKINRTYLEILKPILEKTESLCHFYISGAYFTDLHYLHLQKELEAILPSERFRLMRQLKADQYFPFIEQCHFGIDSYHFGGYNRIIDSLHCGRPMVVLEGDKIYNRAGALVLRQLELDELIAQNKSELIEKSVRLVDDHTYRTELTARIRTLDMLPILEAKNSPSGYRHAMDAMVADYHANSLSDRTPIVIDCT